jgi:pSer/pThr/pTyr-binding forkhead associated (FHA) protein
MQAKLHLIKGNPQGKQVEVPEGTVTVGRAEDSDLIIASTRVSRHHCEIVNEQNRLVIRDKGSGNGTLVNGANVQEQVLVAGDEVQVGPLTFVVEINGKREKSAAPGPVARPAAAQPKPAAPQRPVATQPKPVASLGKAPARPAQPHPKAAQPKPGPVPAGKRPAPDDILASLERLAGKKPPGKPGAAPPAQKKAGDQAFEISDEDLLDPDK